MNTYKTVGTCSKEINFEIEENRIKNVTFTSGCSGNLQGLSSLVEGMDINEVISKLKGINCNGRGTSCPDQLSCALIDWQNNNN